MSLIRKEWQIAWKKQNVVLKLQLQITVDPRLSEPRLSEPLYTRTEIFVMRRDLTFACCLTKRWLVPLKSLQMGGEEGQQGKSDTINACSNATGTVKLPLQLIGKAKKPRCFKHVNMELLPVQYRGQCNAWMSCEIFSEWFNNSFVPTVRKELSKLGLAPKAVLVLDNCPAHPDVDNLFSDDGKIFARFLPPNVTSLNPAHGSRGTCCTETPLQTKTASSSYHRGGKRHISRRLP